MSRHDDKTPFELIYGVCIRVEPEVRLSPNLHDGSGGPLVCNLTLQEFSDLNVLSVPSE